MLFLCTAILCCAFIAPKSDKISVNAATAVDNNILDKNAIAQAAGYNDFTEMNNAVAGGTTLNSSNFGTYSVMLGDMEWWPVYVSKGSGKVFLTLWLKYSIGSYSFSDGTYSTSVSSPASNDYQNSWIRSAINAGKTADNGVYYGSWSGTAQPTRYENHEKSPTAHCAPTDFTFFKEFVEGGAYADYILPSDETGDNVWLPNYNDLLASGWGCTAPQFANNTSTRFCLVRVSQTDDNSSAHVFLDNGGAYRNYCSNPYDVRPAINVVLADANEVTAPDKPTEDAAAFTYSGAPQTYIPTGFSESTMDITGNVQTNANEDGYTVTVTPKCGAWSDGTTDPVTFNFVINKAALTAAISGLPANWNEGESQTANVNINGLIGSDNVTVNAYCRKSGSSAVSVSGADGNYTLPSDLAHGSYIFYVELGDNLNYSMETASVNFTVESSQEPEEPDPSNPGGGGTTDPTDPDNPGGGGTTDPTDPDNPGSGGTTDPTDPDNPGGGGTTDSTDPDNPGSGGTTDPTDPDNPGGGGTTDPTDPDNPGSGGTTDPTDPDNPGSGGTTDPTDPGSNIVNNNGIAAAWNTVRNFMSNTVLGLPVWAWFLIGIAVLILLIIIIAVACKHRKSKEERELAKARKEEEKARREEERQMQREKLEAERELAKAKQEAELEKIRAQAGMASMAMQQAMPVQPVQQAQQHAAAPAQMTGDVAMALAKIEAELAQLRANQNAPQSGYTPAAGGMDYHSAYAEERARAAEAKLLEERVRIEERARAAEQRAMLAEERYWRGGNAIPAEIVVALLQAVSNGGNAAPVNIASIPATAPAAIPQSVEESTHSSHAQYPSDAVITTTTTVDTTKTKPVMHSREAETNFDIDGFYDKI